MSKNIAFVSTTRYPYRRNSARFQRLKYLGENFQVYFFGKDYVCPELEKLLNQKKLLKVPVVKKTLFPFWVMTSILILSSQVQIDIVYTDFAPLSLIAGFVLKKMNFTWIADLWDDPEKSVMIRRQYAGIVNGFRWMWQRLMFEFAKRTLVSADMVITTLMPEVQSKYGVEGSKIISVTNGVDLDIDYPQFSRDYRDKLSIVFVGFVMQNRLETLMEALLLVEGVIDFCLQIIGPMWEQQDQKWITRFLKNNGLEDNVVLTGELEHAIVLDFVSAADICVCPYPDIQDLNSVYPIKVLEYMAMGKPVVATKLRGISEIIESGRSGLLVTPDSPSEMADALLKLYRDESLRHQLGFEARNRVEVFEWKKINQKIDSSLKRLFNDNCISG